MYVSIALQYLYLDTNKHNGPINERRISDKEKIAGPGKITKDK